MEIAATIAAGVIGLAFALVALAGWRAEPLPPGDYFHYRYMKRLDMVQRLWAAIAGIIAYTLCSLFSAGAVITLLVSAVAALIGYGCANIALEAMWAYGLLRNSIRD